jgi:hypothetical protein
MECWNKLLDHIYGLARDIPWLREECGMVLVEAAKSLQGRKEYEECAKEMIGRLSAFKLNATPEGVAIWLTVRADYEEVLPEGVWHHKDPLSKKERARLAKILKENYQGGQEDGSADTLKTAAASPNPTFAWQLVLSEILSRDEQSRNDGKESSKEQFPQFWIDAVDSKYSMFIFRQHLIAPRQSLRFHRIPRTEGMGFQATKQHDYPSSRDGSASSIQSQSDAHFDQSEQERGQISSLCSIDGFTICTSEDSAGAEICVASFRCSHIKERQH